MLGVPVDWLVATLLLIAIWIYQFRKNGAAVALGITVTLSIAFPVWLKIHVLGAPLNVRVALAIIALLGFTVQRRGNLLTPLTLLDLMVTIIWMVHVSADVNADGLAIATPFRAYGEWVLPYVAGRFAVQTADDLKQLVPWVSGVVIALSLCAILESLLGLNAFEMLFGDRPVSGFARNASRFGLKRAFANTMHPIFLAMQLLLLAPFCFGLIATKSGWIRNMRAWVCLLLTALGISATVSRGPIVAFVMMLAVIVFIAFRSIRWLVVVGLLTVIAVVSIAPSATLNFLREQVGEHKTLVEIDGEAREYSGTSNRLLIFDAYGDALRHAGLTGYGTKLTTGFPPNIPYLQVSRHSVQRLRLVDNAYVLLTLRFGFLGLGAFVFLLLSGIYTATCLIKLRPSESFYLAFCGCLIGFAAVMMTVWMSYDFGFIYLWMLGILAGCAVAPNDRISPYGSRSATK